MADLEAGERLGPYLLLFRLGKGGMGEVWAAGHADRPIEPSELLAVKVMRDGDLDSNHAAMFRDEARVAQAMDHPGIIRTLDSGIDRGRMWLSMELVRGPSLTALLQRLVVEGGRLPVAVAVEIGLSLAEALAYAHEDAILDGRPLHLVHRDVSPHNVLLDVDGRILLTDFGIARFAAQEHLSRVGTVRGKPSYMAPEQVTGASLDARTDLFALGIVLHECLALQRLFGRSEPSKSIEAVLHHPAPALDNVLPDVDHWVRRCLEKAPHRRPTSAREFLNGLRAAARPLGTYRPQLLRDLMLQHFDPEEFDVQPRVTEGLVAAKVRGNLPPAREPTVVQTVLLTRNAESPTQAALWPASPARDPLAPEALEQVRTALVARGRLQGSGSVPPPPAKPEPGWDRPARSAPSRVSESGESRSTAGGAGARLVPWLMAFLATVVLGALGAAVWSGPPSSELPTVPRSVPSPEPGAAPGPRAVASPPTAGPGATPAPTSLAPRALPSPKPRVAQDPASPKPRVAQDPSSPEPRAAPDPVPPGPDPASQSARRRAPARPSPRARRSAPNPASPSASTATPGPKRPARTRAEVFAALEQLARVDPDRAQELKVSFVEYLGADGNDPEVFDRFFRQARRATNR